MWIEYTEERKTRLIQALRRDDAMDFDDWYQTLRAAMNVPVGAFLPYELPDGSDGDNNLEHASIALDYYGIA
jgi:hypothetical protein